MADRYEFLPISKEDMEERGWYWYDFLLVTGDAYVDHPSFGIAVIARVLESAGMRVAILAEPDVKNAGAFLAMGKPRYAVMITAGNIDSMVSNYTVAKKRRHDDSYASGGRGGRRPDRASIVYARLAICPSFSAGLRRRCAGLHTTTTGRIASAGRFSLTRAPTLSCSVWVRRRSWRSRAASKRGRTCAR